MAKKAFNTIVIKVGSSSLTDVQGKLDTRNLRRLTSEISLLVKARKNVLLVTSGSIVCGAEALKLGKPKTIPAKQAAAAVGQSRLMRQWEKAFEKHGLMVAQILLTRDEISDHQRYQNARNTIATLLKEKVVPIVNENDTVAIEEIKIGDNDNLAALAAGMIKADILILLTDVDGFYMHNAKGKHVRIAEITEISKAVEDAAGHPVTQAGTGGMITKIQAARTCARAGIPMVICHGRQSNAIKKILSGEKVGTLFNLSSR
jgi:glutamate 5-kinase